MFNKHLTHFIVLAGSQILMHHTYARSHVVQPKDTLSEVLYSLGLTPIYGKDGYLTLILKKNPWLIQNQGNLIKPGEVISLEQMLQVIQTDVPLKTPASITEPTQENESSVPINTQNKIHNSDLPSELTIGIHQGSVTIHGTDEYKTNGTLNSSNLYGAHLEWSPKINEKASIAIGSNYQSVKFNTALTRTLKNKNLNLNSYYISGQYKFQPTWQLELKLGQSDQIYYRATDLNTIEINTNSVFQTQAAIKYDFWEYRNFKYSLKTGFKVHYPFSSDYYKGEFGNGYFGSLFMEQRFTSFDLVGNATYSYDSLPVKGADFESRSFQIGIGVRFFLGDKK